MGAKRDGEAGAARVRALRMVRRGIARFKPVAENVLQLLDWADWKTWVWYSILGVEKVTNELVRWMKRTSDCPARLVLKNGKFYIRPARKKRQGV